MNKPTETFYFEVLNWVKSLIKPNRTVLIGINGPQGSGKTTLCEALVKLSPSHGFQSATLSIDDFYLTHEEQVALAKKNPDKGHLQQRGYPGTHDITLGTKILSKLKLLKHQGEVLCPQYNKSAFGGEGDRFPESEWKMVKGPIDVILFEGWMLGFREKAYSPWHQLLDAFLFLEPKEIEYAIDWRVEAEEKRKAEGKAGLSKEAITEYVKKFIPAYEKYHPLLKEDLSQWKDRKHYRIGKNRLPGD